VARTRGKHGQARCDPSLILSVVRVMRRAEGPARRPSRSAAIATTRCSETEAESQYSGSHVRPEPTNHVHGMIVRAPAEFDLHARLPSGGLELRGGKVLRVADLADDYLDRGHAVIYFEIPGNDRWPARTVASARRMSSNPPRAWWLLRRRRERSGWATLLQPGRSSGFNCGRVPRAPLSRLPCCRPHAPTEDLERTVRGPLRGLILRYWWLRTGDPKRFHRDGEHGWLVCATSS
jgi:hypothetical protein